MQIFKGILFLKATNNTKTVYFVAAGWVLQEGCVDDIDVCECKAFVVVVVCLFV